VELAVLADHRVRLVDVERDGDGLLGLDVAKAGVLEEVAAEGVAGIAGGLVPGRDPGASLDQIVLPVEGGGREIVVPGVDLEAVKPRDRGLRPLPDVADHVVKITEQELRDRARRGVVLGRFRLPARSQYGWSVPTSRSRAGTTSSVGSRTRFRPGALPVAEGLGFR
jgi:hypothetical protein